MKGRDIRNIIKQMSAELALVYSDDAEAKSVVEILLIHHLGISRMELYSNGSELPVDDKLRAINADFERLLKNEPIQYVIGKAWFAGLELRVAPGVLIPRPETEELVQWIVSSYSNCQNEIELLDIGTGSGCIALALKSFLPEALVKGLDFSEEALKIARINANLLNLDVEFLQSDILSDSLPASVRKRRIVVSNPPYVLESEKAEMAERVKRFEPDSALFVPDNDPLLFYTRILDVSKDRAEAVYFEINPLVSEQLLGFAKNSWINTEQRNDFFGKNRMLCAKGINPQ